MTIAIYTSAMTLMLPPCYYGNPTVTISSSWCECTLVSSGDFRPDCLSSVPPPPPELIKITSTTDFAAASPLLFKMWWNHAHECNGIGTGTTPTFSVQLTNNDTFAICVTIGRIHCFGKCWV